MGSVKKIPMRKCVGCGEMKSKKEMMKATISFFNIFMLIMANVKQINTERKNQKRVKVSMITDFTIPAGDGIVPSASIYPI